MTERELALVRLAARALERACRPRSICSAQRLVRLEALASRSASSRDDLVASSRISRLRVEHPRRDLVAGAAGDAAVGVDDRAVERDERRADAVARAGAARRRDRSTTIASPTSAAHERLVLRREAQRDRRAARRRPRRRAAARCAPATNGGRAGRSVARPALLARELGEQRRRRARRRRRPRPAGGRRASPASAAVSSAGASMRSATSPTSAGVLASRAAPSTPAPTPSSRACISSSARRRERFCAELALRLLERALALGRSRSRSSLQLARRGARALRRVDHACPSREVLDRVRTSSLARALELDARRTSSRSRSSLELLAARASSRCWRRSKPASVASALAIVACALGDRLPELGDLAASATLLRRASSSSRSCSSSATLGLARLVRPRASRPRASSGVALARRARDRALVDLVLLARRPARSRSSRRLDPVLARARSRPLRRGPRCRRRTPRSAPSRARSSAACASRRAASSSASRASSSAARLRRPRA